MRLTLPSSLPRISVHVTREQGVLALLVISTFFSLGAVAVDAFLFLRYYRIATEPAPPPPQSRVEIQKDNFEKAVNLIRARLQE